MAFEVEKPSLDAPNAFKIPTHLGHLKGVYVECSVAKNRMKSMTIDSPNDGSSPSTLTPKTTCHSRHEVAANYLINCTNCAPH